MTSGMSYMETLLEGVQVEWKPLGELGELVRGNGLPKKDFTDKGVPAIHYGEIYTYYGNVTHGTKSFVSEKTAQSLKKVNKNDVVITNTSENLSDVGKSLLYLGDSPAVTGGHATIFKPNKLIKGKFFVYYTQTEDFFNKKRKLAKGSKVTDVSANDLSKIIIPVPPLSIQNKIIRILDKFTALTTELTTELTNRRKQYNYYREKLLAFGGNVEWKPLKKLASYSKDRINSIYVNHDNYVSVDTLLQNKAGRRLCQHLPSTEMNIAYKKGDILIGNIRPYLKKIWLADQNGGTNGDVLVIQRTSDRIIEKYLYYILSDDRFFTYAMQHSKGAKMPRGDKEKIMDFPLPIPPLAEQKRIVAILDKFDTLTSSITEGLPREIELRQKQYEYYRDKLLTFPRA